MSSEAAPDYSSVVSATGFLLPKASRSLADFQEHIIISHRILALAGAGLSAPSGLPTFRGVGGLWRNYDAKQLSTPQAFDQDPALVWTFYLERRNAARNAKPNDAHVALAELAKKRPEFLMISMNIDGLSERASHPPNQIKFLHGNLFDVRCTKCDLVLHGEAADLAVVPLEHVMASSPSAQLNREDLPRCPNQTCQDGILRPGVVWFTESLLPGTLADIHKWLESEPTIDTMLVIGTSAEVYPATAYIEAARKKGARVAVVNVEKEDVGLLALQEQDWYLEGDAAKLVPEMLKPIIGGSKAAPAAVPDTQATESVLVTESVVVSGP